MSVEAFTSYLSKEKNYSPHTVKAYRKDLEDFSDFYRVSCTDNSIDKANYSEVRDWIVSLVDSGISNRSVNRKITSLKSYYKFLLKVGAIGANPLAKHKALKIPKKVEIPFSQSEMAQLLGSVPFEDDFEGLRDRLIIELFYATGMRRSELINLELSDLDLSGQSIRVLGKRNKERIIPLLPGIISLIEAYLKQRDSLENSERTHAVFITSKREQSL